MYGSCFEWFSDEKQFCFNHVTATVLHDNIKTYPEAVGVDFVFVQIFYVRKRSSVSVLSIPLDFSGLSGYVFM